MVSLKTKQANESLQLEIEKYLFDSKNIYYNSIKGKININYNQESSKFIINKTDELSRILKRDYSKVDSNYGNSKRSFYRNLRFTSEIVH